MLKASRALVLLGLGLAGCGPQPSPALRAALHAPPPPGPSPASVTLATLVRRFDGSYQGPAQQVVRLSPLCPFRRYGVLEVGDGALNFAYTPDQIFASEVRPDGSIHGHAGTAVMEGRILDGFMLLRVRSPQCETRFRLHYVWNRS